MEVSFFICNIGTFTKKPKLTEIVAMNEFVWSGLGGKNFKL